MGNYHIVENLEEAVDRCEVILQTKTGFADYAKIYEEKNIMQGRRIVAFIGEHELQLNPEEYGETWRCIVPDMPPLEEVVYMNPF